MHVLRATFRTVCALAAAVTAFSQAGKPVRELITCGRERVHIFDLDAVTDGKATRALWTWQAAGRKDLPAEYHALFRSTDECKPVHHGEWILITSSGGGVALVERAKNQVLFYGRAVNAHSADLLPDNRVAVAASRDPRTQKGDSLILFDVKQPGVELWRTELPAGHGVVWDGPRQILWALSNTDIRAYRLQDWDTPAPSLKRDAIIPLPEGGGHELFPVPGTPFLAVSTTNHCWVFDRDKRSVTPHPLLGDAASIKCISTHPVTGQIAYTQAEEPNWWTERVRLLSPTGSVSFANEQFYKVRWNVSEP